MQKGVKFRIYPNKDQKNLINQTFGCCRLIYNKGLAVRNEAYENGEKIGYSKTSAILTDLKKTEEFAFLRNVDSIALQQSLRDLDRGFVNFFQKRAAHPVFKSKHNNRQSYRTINQGDNIRIVGKYIKLPKLGLVKIKQSMDVGYINNITVERTPTGKYFVVLNVEFEPKLKSNNGGSIGIDMGVRRFYSDSNGNIANNPKHLNKSMDKLIREQRKLSRKQKNSNNRNKQRIRVALVHEKITNQRNDFLQKQSTILIRENQTICIEDISVRDLLSDISNTSTCKRQERNLHRSLYAASWSKFVDMLKYKATWYDNTLIKVPKEFPSSEICSACGYINPSVKNLAIRKWKCPSCNTMHDRDINAAINILNKELVMV